MTKSMERIRQKRPIYMFSVAIPRMSHFMSRYCLTPGTSSWVKFNGNRNVILANLDGDFVIIREVHVVIERMADIHLIQYVVS